jgi:hypothetical protein
MNTRNEPLFLVSATGTCSVGTKKNNDRFSLDYREVDLVFMDLTEKHVSMIVSDCEVSIFGAVVISYNADIKYPCNMVNSLIDSNDERIIDNMYATAETIADGIVNLISPVSEDVKATIKEQLSYIVQNKRRSTTVKVLPMKWRVTASPAQINRAQQENNPVEALEHII